MIRKVFSSSLVKTTILISMSLMIYKCASTPAGNCPMAVIQRLLNATEEVRIKNLMHWDITEMMFRKQITLEKALYLLASYQIIHPMDSTDLYRNWEFTSGFFQHLCRPPQPKTNIVNPRVTFCSNVARDINNCLLHIKTVIRILLGLKYIKLYFSNSK
ncbi:hypothetical protein RF11_06083 [Thelohanellus kitauei]|uniref:Uncharacterized protein n=1 Tax=Thelohanellus kitauei TaxID=669202 RepID=A0A0C2MDH8_THEKT|nr:hypothetical protein RF11_06083 [Thelohanellus kitauei]